MCFCVPGKCRHWSMAVNDSGTINFKYGTQVQSRWIICTQRVNVYARGNICEFEKLVAAWVSYLYIAQHSFRSYLFTSSFFLPAVFGFFKAPKITKGRDRTTTAFTLARPQKKVNENDLLQSASCRLVVIIYFWKICLFVKGTRPNVTTVIQW